jgi:aminopeptidase N
MHRVLVPLVLAAPVLAQSEELTSGRPQPPEQACYDVEHYGLDVRVDPARETIEGSVSMLATLLAETDALVVDLDDRLEVKGVTLGPVGDDAGVPVEFRHENGEIRVETGEPGEALAPGERFVLRVEYGGSPRVAPNPPWEGGIQWEETPSGAPWIATSNQMQGADLWWPCKDQPDDEPEGMSISVTVPAPLVCASNGRLVAVEEEEEGWLTYRWSVTTPINVYGVALNIGPYVTISRDYESVAGDVFPVTYWVLPENLEKGKVLFEDILRQVRFFEETFGPYPFRADKYGVVETPHLGMEHQSIIAYGNEYSGNPWGQQRGFDFLHHHEMAHEWWANLVTCRNWKDFWIHEGFATYAQALYVEELHGAEAYRETLVDYRSTLKNEGPVAPREASSTADIYFGPSGGDIYYKGSWILHTLRWVVGDETFFPALRRMAYPDPALEKTTDGSACRFTDTEEIRAIAEEVTGVELGWFFEVYLRQPELPTLEVNLDEGELRLEWKVPNGLPFPMPVEVEVDGELRRVEMEDGRAAVPVGGAGDVRVDPRNRVLMELG